ncbi:flagellar biosynthetic protein FliR [Spectribacter hydrogenoxidans]|uniref:Flagellar biosynthetic protein FliR n=1 Tax=Spectribacter hydrogenoxidans TaxID=3075608 RepID=A0ABU3BVQ6_9GAMM|nr:flagellar biosynthetic protein FliR [Salinisphaera sp. W335]MDT0633371.1 flagellar biosynthetic protein FliR [Salinisphaera sp. W335]
MSFTVEQLAAWVNAFFWPFLRVGAMTIAAPVFGSRMIAARARLTLAVAVTIALMAILPPPPVLATFSVAWWTAVLQQMLIGLTMGFVLQLVFEGIVLGGMVIAMGAGLGFATLADPLRGVQTPVVSQYFVILTTLLFLALGGHLALISFVATSFHTLPVGAIGFTPDVARAVADYGVHLFAGAMQIALPATLAILVVNLSFGIISRSAPSLNLFAIGLPAALLFALAVLPMTLDAMAVVFERRLEQAWAFIAAFIGV